MRILQVHNRHRVEGGEDHAVERERELLAERGHHVVQHVVENPTDHLASVWTYLQAPWNVSAATRVVARARQESPDLVHVHNTWFSLSPSVVAGLDRAGFPVVMTLHNFRIACINGLLLRRGKPCTLCIGSHPWHGVWHRCYRDSAMLSAVAASTVEIPRRVGTWQRAVDMFVVLDGRAVPELVAGGVPADKIAVRSNAARDPGPRPSPPSQSSEVVYAGRLSHEKGADLLLEAWRRAAPAGLNLVLYGDGALRAELERQRVEGVSFRGHVDRSELEKRLLGARALVFPSTCQEAADPPMAPLEAAAAGLPAIISSTVGFSNRAQSAGAGWSVPPDDVAAFAAALTSLHDDERIDEAGRAARAMYEQSFSDEAAYGSLVAVYERAISMRP